MGFIDEIKNFFSSEELPKEPVYRAVIFGDSAVYFENVRCIAHYDCEQIILSLRRGGIKISGKNLYIKKYCAGDVTVCGTILAIERI